MKFELFLNINRLFIENMEKYGVLVIIIRMIFKEKDENDDEEGWGEIIGLWIKFKRLF